MLQLTKTYHMMNMKWAFSQAPLIIFFPTFLLICIVLLPIDSMLDCDRMWASPPSIFVKSSPFDLFRVSDRLKTVLFYSITIR